MIVDLTSLKYIEETTQNVLSQCRTRLDITIDEKNRHLTLYVPSGDMKYKSFWVRDAAMMASSGLIPAVEIQGWLALTANCQNGPEQIDLANGLKVPPWSIADHISDDGKAIYFPGTYCSGHDQGQGGFGYYPPHDDQYYFIDMAYQYFRLSGEIAFFKEKINDVSLLERLGLAFASYQIDPESQLCVSNMPHYTVDWGFCDTIVKSGFLLFPSILRYQAACQLQEIYAELQEGDRVEEYGKIAEKIRNGIEEHLQDRSGWLMSATEISRQKDVWGTAFAVWTGLLQGAALTDALRAMVGSYTDGAAVTNGYVRHILEGEDAVTNTMAWERTRCPYGTYQNGGYWATPTGWYIYALAQSDALLAEQMLHQFVDYNIAQSVNGAPYEWISRNNSIVDGRLYGASAALPYAALRRLICEAK